MTIEDEEAMMPKEYLGVLQRLQKLVLMAILL